MILSKFFPAKSCFLITASLTLTTIVLKVGSNVQANICVNTSDDLNNTKEPTGGMSEIFLILQLHHIHIVCFSNHDTSISNCYNLGTHKIEPKI